MASNTSDPESETLTVIVAGHQWVKLLENSCDSILDSLSGKISNKKFNFKFSCAEDVHLSTAKNMILEMLTPKESEQTVDVLKPDMIYLELGSPDLCNDWISPASFACDMVSFVNSLLLEHGVGTVIIGEIFMRRTMIHTDIGEPMSASVFNDRASQANMLIKSLVAANKCIVWCPKTELTAIVARDGVSEILNGDDGFSLRLDGKASSLLTNLFCNTIQAIAAPSALEEKKGHGTSRKLSGSAPRDVHKLKPIEAEDQGTMEHASCMPDKSNHSVTDAELQKESADSSVNLSDLDSSSIAIHRRETNIEKHVETEEHNLTESTNVIQVAKEDLQIQIKEDKKEGQVTEGQVNEGQVTDQDAGEIISAVSGTTEHPLFEETLTCQADQPEVIFSVEPDESTSTFVAQAEAELVAEGTKYDESEVSLQEAPHQKDGEESSSPIYLEDSLEKEDSSKLRRSVRLKGKKQSPSPHKSNRKSYRSRRSKSSIDDQIKEDAKVDMPVENKMVKESDKRDSFESSGTILSPSDLGNQDSEKGQSTEESSVPSTTTDLLETKSEDHEKDELDSCGSPCGVSSLANFSECHEQPGKKPPVINESGIDACPAEDISSQDQSSQENNEDLPMSGENTVCNNQCTHDQKEDPTIKTGKDIASEDQSKHGNNEALTMSDEDIISHDQPKYNKKEAFTKTGEAIALQDQSNHDEKEDTLTISGEDISAWDQSKHDEKEEAIIMSGDDTVSRDQSVHDSKEALATTGEDISSKDQSNHDESSSTKTGEGIYSRNESKYDEKEDAITKYLEDTVPQDQSKHDMEKSLAKSGEDTVSWDQSEHDEKDDSSTKSTEDIFSPDQSKHDQKEEPRTKSGEDIVPEDQSKHDKEEASTKSGEDIVSHNQSEHDEKADSSTKSTEDISSQDWSKHDQKEEALANSGEDMVPQDHSKHNEEETLTKSGEDIVSHDQSEHDEKDSSSENIFSQDQSKHDQKEVALTKSGADIVPEDQLKHDEEETLTKFGENISHEQSKHDEKEAALTKSVEDIACQDQSKHDQVETISMSRSGEDLPSHDDSIYDKEDASSQLLEGISSCDQPNHDRKEEAGIISSKDVSSQDQSTPDQKKEFLNTSDDFVTKSQDGQPLMNEKGESEEKHVSTGTEQPYSKEHDATGVSDADQSPAHMKVLVFGNSWVRTLQEMYDDMKEEFMVKCSRHFEMKFLIAPDEKVLSSCCELINTVENFHPEIIYFEMGTHDLTDTLAPDFVRKWVLLSEKLIDDHRVRKLIFGSIPPRRKSKTNGTDISQVNSQIGEANRLMEWMMVDKINYHWSLKSPKNVYRHGNPLDATDGTSLEKDPKITSLYSKLFCETILGVSVALKIKPVEKISMFFIGHPFLPLIKPYAGSWMDPDVCDVSHFTSGYGRMNILKELSLEIAGLSPNVVYLEGGMFDLLNDSYNAAQFRQDLECILVHLKKNVTRIVIGCISFSIDMTDDEFLKHYCIAKPASNLKEKITAFNKVIQMLCRKYSSTHYAESVRSQKLYTKAIEFSDSGKKQYICNVKNAVMSCIPNVLEKHKSPTGKKNKLPTSTNGAAAVSLAQKIADVIPEQSSQKVADISEKPDVQHYDKSRSKKTRRVGPSGSYTYGAGGQGDESDSSVEYVGIEEKSPPKVERVLVVSAYCSDTEMTKSLISLSSKKYEVECMEQSEYVRLMQDCALSPEKFKWSILYIDVGIGDLLSGSLKPKDLVDSFVSMALNLQTVYNSVKIILGRPVPRNSADLQEKRKLDLTVKNLDTSITSNGNTRLVYWSHSTIQGPYSDVNSSKYAGSINDAIVLKLRGSSNKQSDEEESSKLRRSERLQEKKQSPSSHKTTRRSDRSRRSSSSSRDRSKYSSKRSKSISKERSTDTRRHHRSRSMSRERNRYSRSSRRSRSSSRDRYQDRRRSRRSRSWSRDETKHERRSRWSRSPSREKKHGKHRRSRSLSRGRGKGEKHGKSSHQDDHYSSPSHGPSQEYKTSKKKHHSKKRKQGFSRSPSPDYSSPKRRSLSPEMKEKLYLEYAEITRKYLNRSPSPTLKRKYDCGSLELKRKYSRSPSPAVKRKYDSRTPSHEVKRKYSRSPSPVVKRKHYSRSPSPYLDHPKKPAYTHYAHLRSPSPDPHRKIKLSHERANPVVYTEHDKYLESYATGFEKVGESEYNRGGNLEHGSRSPSAPEEETEVPLSYFQKYDTSVPAVQENVKVLVVSSFCSSPTVLETLTLKCAQKNFTFDCMVLNVFLMVLQQSKGTDDFDWGVVFLDLGAHDMLSNTDSKPQKVADDHLVMARCLLREYGAKEVIISRPFLAKSTMTDSADLNLASIAFDTKIYMNTQPGILYWCHSGLPRIQEDVEPKDFAESVFKAVAFSQSKKKYGQKTPLTPTSSSVHTGSHQSEATREKYAHMQKPVPKERTHTRESKQHVPGEKPYSKWDDHQTYRDKSVVEPGRAYAEYGERVTTYKKQVPEKRHSRWEDKPHTMAVASTSAHTSRDLQREYDLFEKHIEKNVQVSKKKQKQPSGQKKSSSLSLLMQTILGDK